MNITPLVKKIRADKEVLFHKKEIHVEGITTNDADFNTWIAALTEKSWVQKVDIESYTQDRTRKKSFVIHIYF
jgi:Tfp pilus assembly protein PilN